MSKETDLIDGEIAAYRKRDLNAFLDFYAADVVIKDADGNVLVQGLQGMHEFYEPLFRDSPDLKVEIPTRIALGEYVIDEELIDGVNVEGFPRQLHAAAVNRVKDGKISGATFLM
jgi:hypothetical protein